MQVNYRQLRSGKIYPTGSGLKKVVYSKTPRNSVPNLNNSGSDSDSLINLQIQRNLILSQQSLSSEENIAEVTEDVTNKITESLSPISSNTEANNELSSLFGNLSIQAEIVNRLPPEPINMAQFDREDFKMIPEFGGNPKDLHRFLSIVTDMNNELAED